MATINLNGTDVEVPEGAPLVEVIKNHGTFISNLCYIDGLPPYAGCRTCIVEIEGQRGFQLSCTSKVADGMIVRTQTPELHSTQQAVLSLIMSYHADRCLTCHRVVKCKPGDTWPARRHRDAPLPDLLEELPLRAADDLRTAGDGRLRTVGRRRAHLLQPRATGARPGQPLPGIRPADVHHLHPLRPRLRRAAPHRRDHAGRPRLLDADRLRRRRPGGRIELRLLRAPASTSARRRR